MVNLDRSVIELIHKRFSCRHYARSPIPTEKRGQLEAFIASLPLGPFGARPRFGLVAATGSESNELRGLGTYGFIKNPRAYIIGAMQPSKFDLEDFGYLMEAIILYATGLGLGTCWLGGTFTKSTFSRKIDLDANETIPAATSLGTFSYPDQKRLGLASRTAGSEGRLPWEMLFFNADLKTPLDRVEAADYASALEMVKLGPSASNKQPWRIVKLGRSWRFYLKRTPGYREDLIKRVLDLCDLQRLDMGIAMCHFELTARELGLEGKWIREEELNEHPAPLTEYIVTWEAQDG